jgi:hypothetical protein
VWLKRREHCGSGRVPQPAEKSAPSMRNNTYGKPKNTGTRMGFDQPDGFPHCQRMGICIRGLNINKGLAPRPSPFGRLPVCCQECCFLLPIPVIICHPLPVLTY